MVFGVGDEQVVSVQAPVAALDAGGAEDQVAACELDLSAVSNGTLSYAVGRTLIRQPSSSKARATFR